jgi:pimeloyl-ACP methyl ester carboxylesterase
VYIFHGIKDKIVNIKYAQEIYGTIGHDKCLLKIDEKVGHMPPIEIPQELAHEILSFGEK